MQSSRSTQPDAAGEQRLVEAAKADRGAFAVLYRAHYAGVVGYLYRRTGDTHVAEDLAAETFLAAFRAIRRYQSKGVPLRIWLLRIATNQANRWARNRGRLKLRPAEGEVLEIPAPAAAPEPGLEDAQRALLNLAPEHQDVISLHYIEGLSLEEVAAVVGCKVGTVKSRLFRGRVAMRRELERRSKTHD